MRNPSQVQEAIALHIQAIINLIGAGGEANNLDLVNTPKRVAVMFTEDLFSGYRSSEEDLAKSMHTTDIDQPYGMVVETNIPFTTVCAHHLMPFQGTAAIGYQPKSKLLGLSKLPRILYHYAARLQIQERLTHQVASFILEHAEALAVFVLLKAEHGCMACRGIKRAGIQTVTQCFLATEPAGQMLADDFFRLVAHGTK